MKLILALDFDGVVHRYSSRYTKATEIHDPPTPGFWDFLAAAQDSGLEVHIHSSRNHHNGGPEAIVRWLRKHAPNDSARERVERIQITTHKPPWMVFLDDRALTFTGTWPSIEALKAFRPWHEQEVTRSEAEEISRPYNTDKVIEDTDPTTGRKP